MFVLRQYTGFVFLAFVPLTVLFASCTIGYLLVMAGKKLTRIVLSFVFRKYGRAVEPNTRTNAARIQPRVNVAARLEA